MRKPIVLVGVLVILFGISLVSLGVLRQKQDEQKVQSEQTTAISVNEVIDGDTLKMSEGTTVRLIGINAPERSEPYYNEAKTNLENLVIGKNLDMQFDLEKMDRYGRTLAYLFTDNSFINKKMIEEGVAVIETISPNVSRSKELVQAQDNARNKCKGIWEGLCSNDSSVCVQISEVYDGEGASSLNSEWIELTNTCSSAEDLTGYLIKDSSASNSYLFKSFMLNSKSKVKLYSGCSVDTSNSVYWQCPTRSGAVWNNEGDSAYLFNSGGKLVSQISY